MNARPHPGLLPQEKENPSPAFGNANAPGCRAAFPANDETAALAQGASKLSSGARNFSLSSGERARVRASVKTILCFALLFYHASVSPLLADDVITNVMSPVVSYQYQDDFSVGALAGLRMSEEARSIIAVRIPLADEVEWFDGLLADHHYLGGSGSAGR